MIKNKHFDFGSNWKNYSRNALTKDKVNCALEDFCKLTKDIDLERKSLLDIGFGQGLTLLISAKLGTASVGVDINPICEEALNISRTYFPELDRRKIPITVGSILSPNVIEVLKSKITSPGYDIVHSWGVLHHTGDMWGAIRNAASLVGPNGYLILALYNKHWTSPLWRLIKKTYMKAAPPMRHLMVGMYLPLSVLRMLISGVNPLKRSRGMTLYYDAVDWVGGYPYEYTDKKELEKFMGVLGFELLKFVHTQGSTGCNEFVFRRC